MREPRPNIPFTARYGTIGQGGEWHEAIEAYYWDRLPEAFAIAQALGAGFGGASIRWYRMIEGEALTRERSVVRDLDDHLSLEYFPGEVELSETHEQALRTAVATVARRLQWDFSQPVRSTILIEEVDAPWHGARFGYCVDKYPYDKICIPFRASIDPDQLFAVVAHEFTHVVTLNLTQGRIPHWLDEGMAMLMENAPARRVTTWLSPQELNAAFEVDRREHEGLERSHQAYLQSVVLVRYLHRLAGDEKLAQLMRAFTNNSFWDEVKINLLGQASVEEALHEVYGFGQSELFDAAEREQG